MRAFFRCLFGVLFLRIRPKWTTELDGYHAGLRLAFEHQGRQHFIWVRRFHRTKGAFKRQLRNDREKVEACRRRGVLLIVVPSLYDMLPEADLRAFIRAACERAGRGDLLPADFETREIDLSSAYCPDYAQDYAWLCAQAEEVGARIEEAGWMGDEYPYHFACTTPGCGRRWRRTATSFRHQRVTVGGRAGCANCSAKLGAVTQRKNLHDVLERARAKEITVLSSPEEIYAYPHARCTLRCERCREAGRTEEEATWKVTRAVLTKGIFGCATCAGKGRLTEQDLLARAQSQTGMWWRCPAR